MSHMTTGYNHHLLTILMFALIAVGVGCPDEENCQDCPEPCDDDVGDDDATQDDDDTTGDDDDSAGDDDDSAADDDDSAATEDADGDGWTVDDGDCDDSDPTVGPHMAEICDGVDNDCDGDVDEDCTVCDFEVPGWSNTIQAAINFSAHYASTVICVSPGTYPENLDFFGLEVHLLGLGGPETTIIQGDGTDSVVRFDTGEGPDSILEGFTITGGLAQKGGGVYVVGGSPTLANLVVENNAAEEYGGGIYLASSEAVLIDVAVTGNTADSGGGGMSAFHSSPLIAGFESADNHVTWGFGGGLHLSEASGLVTGATITANEAFYGGGGIYMSETETTVLQSVIEANVVTSDDYGGGGLYLIDSSPSISNVVVNANEVSGYDGSFGGGIMMMRSSAQLTNTLITSNIAVDGWYVCEGGGIRMMDSSPLLQNVIIAGNEVGGGAGYTSGGGVFAQDSDVVLENVAVVGNTGTNGTSGIYLYESDSTMSNVIVSHNSGDYGLYGMNATVQMSHCNVYGNSGVTFEGITDPTGTDGNVSVAPEFLDGTPVNPLDWDLHLSATSQLIDAGDPSILDPDGSPSDIGAYGGSGAAAWDLDRDGFYEWWLPGPHDPATSPGTDCDDGDGGVYPGNGC